MEGGRAKDDDKQAAQARGRLYWERPLVWEGVDEGQGRGNAGGDADRGGPAVRRRARRAPAPASHTAALSPQPAGRPATRPPDPAAPRRPLKPAAPYTLTAPRRAPPNPPPPAAARTRRFGARRRPSGGGSASARRCGRTPRPRGGWSRCTTTTYFDGILSRDAGWDGILSPVVSRNATGRVQPAAAWPRAAAGRAGRGRGRGRGAPPRRGSRRRAAAPPAGF
jgi:hypothetical protein